MKTNGKTILTAVALLCGLCFSSCVDETIDLDNVSWDSYLSGDYSFPLLHADSVTMRDLLKEYGNIESDEVSIDSVYSGGAFLLAIYYHDTFSYNMQDAENINGSFDGLETSFYEIDLEVTPDNEAENSGARLNLDSISDKQGFYSGQPKGPGNQYRIHKVDFFNTDVTLETEGGSGLNIVSITIGEPGKTYTLVPGSNKLKGVDLSVLHDDTITVKYTNSTASVQKIKIKFKPEVWTVYGWFDLAYDGIKNDTIFADLKSYIGDSRLKFDDPRVAFDIFNTNLGVPLVANLREISTERQTVLFNSGGGYKFDIAYPNEFYLDSDTAAAAAAYTPIDINSGKAGDYSFSQTDFENLVDIQLEKIWSDIELYTDPSNFNTAEAAGFDPAVEPLQFVSSLAQFDIAAKAILPLSMKKGKLVYNNTIPDVDLSFSNDTLATGGRFHIADSTTINLVINWTNALPLSLLATFELLDKDENPVLVDGEPWVQEINMHIGEVGTNGFVIAPTSDTTKISLSKAAYDIRKNVAKVKVSYSSEDDGDGSGTPQEIKVRLDDYFTVQVGIEIKGRVDWTEKETDD